MDTGYLTDVFTPERIKHNDPVIFEHQVPAFQAIHDLFLHAQKKRLNLDIATHWMSLSYFDTAYRDATGFSVVYDLQNFVERGGFVDMVVWASSEEIQESTNPDFKAFVANWNTHRARSRKGYFSLRQSFTNRDLDTISLGIVGIRPSSKSFVTYRESPFDTIEDATYSPFSGKALLYRSRRKRAIGANEDMHQLFCSLKAQCP